MIHKPVEYIGSQRYSSIPPRNGGQALKVFFGDFTAQKHQIPEVPPPIWGRGWGSKIAIVWGASGGIDRAILEKLNANGWTSVALARDTSEIAALADHVYDASFDDPSNIEGTIYMISQEVGEIDFWCYAAGDILSAKVSEMTPQGWSDIILANLTGAYNAIHYSLPLLSDNAHIIFVGAVSERLRLPGMSAYVASKAELEAFATALSKEQRKICDTVVWPGAVTTTFWDQVPLRLAADAALPQ